MTTCLAFLADGRHLIFFHGPHGDACLHLWSPDASEPLASWSPSFVSAVAVWSTLQGRRVGGRVATGHRDGSIRLWDLADVLEAPGIVPYDPALPPPEHAPAKKQTPSPSGKKRRGSGKALRDESE